MVKNKLSYKMLLIVAALLAFPATAQAQLVFGASFDLPADVPAAMAPAFEQLQTLRDEAVSYIRKTITNIKAAIPGYSAKPKTVIGKVPSKNMAEKSSVDIYDPVAVQAAVQELFLQYPSDNPLEKNAYEQQAKNFYYDTLIEMTMSAEILENNLGNMRANIQKIEKEASDPENSESGAGSSGPTEDENGNYYNLYLVNREFNKILRVTEEVMAMYAQFYSARVIYLQQVLPAPYEAPAEEGKDSKAEKTSALMFRQTVAFGQFMKADAMAVKAESPVRAVAVQAQAPAKKLTVAGQVATADSVSVAKKVATPGSLSTNSLAVEAKTQFKTADAGTESGDDAVTAEAAVARPAVELTAIKKLDIKSPLYQSRDKLADLVTLSEAEKVLNKALDAHNTMQMMPTYRNLFKQYELFKRLQQKAAETVAASDQCVLSYLGRRYKKPNLVWYGTDTAPREATDYDSRKGLSGWAISAFQIANSFKTAGLDVDSFIPDTDTLEVDEDSPLDTSALEAKQAKANKEEGTAQHLAAPGDAQEFSDTVREIELLTWQIGAEAAKILAKDQYADKPAYGTAYNPYPVWRDQKNFYNLYLNEKYGNMIEYVRKADLNSLILDIAKIINENSMDQESQESYGSYINQLSGELKKGGGSNKTTAVQKNKAQALSAVNAAKEKELKPYLAEQKRLQEKMNALGAEIKTAGSNLLTADSAAKEADIKAEQSHGELKSMNVRGANSSSMLYNLAASNLDEGRKEAVAQRAKVSELQTQLDEKNAELKKLTAQLEAVDEKVKQAEQKYLLKEGTINRDYSSQLENAAKESTVAVDLISLINAKNIKAPGFTRLINQAIGLGDDARDEAVELINQARKDILNMGDDLYEPAKHAKVVNRHRQLIKDLKQLSRTNLAKKAASLLITSGKSSITSLLSLAFNKPISSICSKTSCNQPDNEYFVGYPAKERDFTAPKEPLAERYAPLHDIVHFDYDDYKNLADKSNNLEYGVAAAFADYGQELPGIWKMILTENPFVEKSVNLGALLRNNGGEDIAFMRGVRYPCLYDNKYVVDVSGGSKSRYLISRDVQKGMPVCRDVKIVNNMLYFTVYDLESYDEESKDYIHDQGEAQSGLPKTDPSELGMFLGYSSDVYFNDSPRAAFERIAVLNEAAQDDSDFKYTLRDTIFHKAMFKDNQIGNFLHFVDKENSIRKNVEEMAISIEDARKSIIAMLSEMGFAVSSDFNLANEADYAYIRGKMDEYKNSLVGTAAVKMAEVDVSDEVVKERYDKLNNVRAALVQDADELVSLSNSVSAGSTLTEEILTEQANQKVIEETQKAGEEAMLNEINQFETPLCVVY